METDIYKVHKNVDINKFEFYIYKKGATFNIVLSAQIYFERRNP